MGDFKCDQCPLIFKYDEVLIAHKNGHMQADEWLYNFYVEKIKPTEIDKPKRKKKKKIRNVQFPDNIPELVPIATETQAAVLNRVIKKPKRMIKRPLPSLKNPKKSNKKENSPKKQSPVNRTVLPVQPEQKRPKLLLKEPEPKNEIPAYEIKLMECQNKRKAEKRELMGLPSLEPYYCKSFGSKNCCFSSIYWASMRRHFDSKHSELKLKLPKEADRHACSCGRTFLEPNRLQEHMENANHKGAIKQNRPEGETDPELEDLKSAETEDGSDDDSVTDWQFYVQN